MALNRASARPRGRTHCRVRLGVQFSRCLRQERFEPDTLSCTSSYDGLVFHSRRAGGTIKDVGDVVSSERGVRLYLHDLGGWIAGTPEAESGRRSFAGVAQFESKRCQQRILEAKAYLPTKSRLEGGEVPFGYRKVESTSGERTPRDTPVCYIQPEPEIHALARNLLLRGYSCRFARGVFVERGYVVSYVAISGLFKKLRAEAAAARVGA